MKTTFHPAHARGGADHGWLKAKHSFSFAGWYDPERLQFGALRVLNDDWIAPATGFGLHPHDNMEIVTIPLSGAIRHKDSFGHEGVIHAGEVQVMSAGKGIYHSEMNPLTDEPTTLLQIWVFPKYGQTDPWYKQAQYSLDQKENQFVTIVSGFDEEGALPFGQDARFSLVRFAENAQLKYKTKKEGQGVYFFLISGSVKIGEITLNLRDALGIEGEQNITIQGVSSGLLLAIEVPMG